MNDRKAASRAWMRQQFNAGRRRALAVAALGLLGCALAIGQAWCAGFALQAASVDGLRELLWRGPESQSNRSFDEDILTQLLEQQGSQTPPSELPDDLNTVLIATAETGNAAGTANQEKRPSPPVHSKSRLLLGGLLLAAMVLVAAAALYLFRDKLNPVSVQTQAPVQTQAQSQAPAAAQSPIASPPAAQGIPSPPADTANPANPGSTETPAPAKAAKKPTVKRQ